MQSVVFGIMIMDGHVVFMIGLFFQKTKLGNQMMKDKFLPYSLIGDVAYPMRPWSYSPFKGEKDGLPRYKTYRNFIQSSTRMSIERTFGMLKGRFKLLLKRVDIPLCHMSDLVMVCICLHNMRITNLDGFDMD
jgi:hypothetical protein